MGKGVAVLLSCATLVCQQLSTWVREGSKKGEKLSEMEGLLQPYTHILYVSENLHFPFETLGLTDRVKSKNFLLSFLKFIWMSKSQQAKT